MKQAFFVAGTDTGVGKTFASCVLLAAAANNGLRTLALKPVAAGCDQVDLNNGKTQWQNEDALLLQKHMSVELPYAQINPVALPVPASPHISAKLANKTLNAGRLVGFCRGAMMTPADFVLIEGAGGWRVPISATETMADLAGQLELKVILVVALRLGCLNHALLTAEAVRRDGLQLAGWVGNSIQAEVMPFQQENIDTLKASLRAPCLGILPFDRDAQPVGLIDCLNLGLLL